MNKGLIIAIVAIVILLAGGFLVVQGSSSPSPTPTEAPLTVGQPSSEETQLSTNSSSPLASSTPEATAQNIIDYTDIGFSPSSLSIKVGESVTWKNDSSAIVQVTSDPHPTHTDYPPLNSVGTIAPEDSKSFTFTKAGTFGYHDHLNPANKGQIIVK